MIRDPNFDSSQQLNEHLHPELLSMHQSYEINFSEKSYQDNNNVVEKQLIIQSNQKTKHSEKSPFFKESQAQFKQFDLNQKLQKYDTKANNQLSLVDHENQSERKKKNDKEIKIKKKHQIKKNGEKRKTRQFLTTEKIIKLKQLFEEFELKKNTQEKITLRQISQIEQVSLSYSTVLHKYKEFKDTEQIQAGVLATSKSSKSRRSYKIENKKTPFLQEALRQKAQSQKQNFQTDQEITDYIKTNFKTDQDLTDFVNENFEKKKKGGSISLSTVKRAKIEILRRTDKNQKKK